MQPAPCFSLRDGDIADPLVPIPSDLRESIYYTIHYITRFLTTHLQFRIFYNHTRRLIIIMNSRMISPVLRSNTHSSVTSRSRYSYNYPFLFLPGAVKHFFLPRHPVFNDAFSVKAAFQEPSLSNQNHFGFPTLIAFDF